MNEMKIQNENNILESMLFRTEAKDTLSSNSTCPLFHSPPCASFLTKSE